MLTLVAKCINDRNITSGYCLYDGKRIYEVTFKDLYEQFIQGNIPMIRGVNLESRQIEFRTLTTIIPIYKYKEIIDGSLAILNLHIKNGKRVGVTILDYIRQVRPVPAEQREWVLRRMTIKALKEYIKGNSYTLFNAHFSNGVLLVDEHSTFVIDDTNPIVYKEPKNIYS